MSNINIFHAVGHGGPHLATRTHARTARHALEHHTATTPPDHDIIIDFTDVDAMTYPYADEFLGNYYASTVLQTPTTTGIVLHGLNDDTRETIALCLHLRGLLAVETHQLRLVGAPEHLQFTYQCATALFRFRASDLARQLNTSLSNANNRLARLVAGRTLRRTRSTSHASGGKEFIYTVPA